MALADQQSSAPQSRPQALARPRRLGRKSAVAMQRGWRIVALAGRNFFANDDWLWASALTYTVALSIVPLLVLAFALLKGLGELSQVEPLILRYLSLQSPVIRHYLRDFLANSQASALGSLGGGSLLFFDIMTLWTIEIALNRIWKAPMGRPFVRKVSDYVSVTIMIPIFLALALAMRGWLGDAVSEIPLASTLMPLMLAWAGYAFLFLFFPYTVVRYRPALAGSFITAVLWLTAYRSYVHFQYEASYAPVYGALAAIPALLVWIYLSWSIVLFGAEISAAAQYGTSGAKPGAIPPDFARKAALLVMIRLAERMENLRGPVRLYDIVYELGVNEMELRPVLARLKLAGFVVEASDPAGSPTDYELFLARAADQITVEAIIATVDERRVRRSYDRRIGSLLSRLEQGEKNLLRGETLRDLVAAGAPHRSRAQL
jgi:membrane protein